MIFKDKGLQDVLEVLDYNLGPKCYGFYQNNYFLAYRLSEDSEGTENWLMVPLSETDLPQYEDLKSKKVSFTEFVSSRPAYVAEFNAKGFQKSEKKVLLDEENLKSLGI